MNHVMIRDANVVAQAVETKHGPSALITVNDRFEHQFPASSRVSKELELITEKDLTERLNGGSYFFIDDQLIDFRDRRYNGFVHEDKSIDALMDVIGFRELKTRTNRATHRLINRTQSNSISLSKMWSRTEIEVPMYREGGGFNSQLNFTWNPFTKNVSSVFELVRLICENGMVGTTPFVNMQIPLVNRWEEHLEISNLQLQNKISGIMKRRLEEMTTSRASVADLLTLDRHISGRLKQKDVPAGQDNKGLLELYRAIDPFEHLTSYYKLDALENKAIAAQLPAHITVFDAWNIATEVCTHYAPSESSTDAGLQKLANSLVFDRACTTNQVENIGSHIKLSPFSSPERAFFGDVQDLETV